MFAQSLMLCAVIKRQHQHRDVPKFLFFNSFTIFHYFRTGTDQIVSPVIIRNVAFIMQGLRANSIGLVTDRDSAVIGKASARDFSSAAAEVQVDAWY